MNVRLLLAVMLLLLLALPLYAENENSKTALGFHAGTSTGVGYAMRWMGPEVGVQATFGAYAINESSAINFAVNGMGILDEFRYGRIYIMAGGMVKYYHHDKYEDPYYPEEEINENRWCVGVGPGLEWILSKQFRLALEIPITYNWKNDIIMYIPQGGIYYYFK